jgi:hypothetical protein
MPRGISLLGMTLSPQSPREPSVQVYLLATPCGLRIRRATKVVFPNGDEVAFMEPLSRRAAIEQARAIIARHAKPVLELVGREVA